MLNVEQTIISQYGTSATITKLIQNMKESKRAKKSKKDISAIEQAQYAFIMDELQKRFATKINLKRYGNKGKIIIDFYSNEDFERIYDLLRGN